MIKGVNKQILEVTNTDSKYFEKIIFFVRPDAQKASYDSLCQEAQLISSKAKKPPKSKKTPRQITGIVSNVGLGVGAGVALTFLLTNFINF
jgi:hypothetical protein